MSGKIVPTRKPPWRSARLLSKRLAWYWKMEASGILLFPALMFWYSNFQLGWPAAIASVPMILILALGAAYWRGKLHQLTHPGFEFEKWLRAISLLQTPALVLTLAGILAAGTAWVFPQISAGLADRVSATGAAALAALEYVNYYHRQLQHFDHLPDFRRLLGGHGFRRSQLAGDLRAFREK